MWSEALRWACPDTVACGFTFFPQTPPHRFERIDLSDLTSGLSLIPAPLGLPLTPGCSNLPLSALLSADLNECGLKPRPCKHRCMNTYGSYKCYCLNGYMLLAWWELWKWVTSRCFARGVQLCQSPSRSIAQSTLCLKRMTVLPSRENRNVCILFYKLDFHWLFSIVVPKPALQRKTVQCKNCKVHTT